MKIFDQTLLKACCLGWFVLFFDLLSAQTAVLSGVVNRYAAVTEIRNSPDCGQQILVSDTSGFRVGDVILIAQQQGASVALINAVAYGAVSALNCAGCIERGQIVGITGKTIYLAERLVNPFDAKNGRVQLVRVPRFRVAIAMDTIFAQPWDGSTGGIVAVEVTDTLILDAPMVASGRGFRGGAAFKGPDNRCNRLTNNNDFVYPSGSWRGGRKGEGLATVTPGQELGRGAWSNGGGGGNDHNAGGGGGSNAAKGGDGGQNLNPEPLDCRGLFPGIGGHNVSAPPDRLWMGGGGGGGHANGTETGEGGSGGGIVVLSAGVLTGQKPQIWATGTKPSIAFSEGGGGGGAGGGIWLSLQQPPANLLVNADGGEGGNTNNFGGDQCTGPGGGGGGGRIMTDVANVPKPKGGGTGVITNTKAACLNGNGNAKPGSNGTAQGLTALKKGPDAGRPQITAMPVDQAVCRGRTAEFRLTMRNGAAAAYQWEVQEPGSATWRDLTNATPYRGVNTPELTVEPVSDAMRASQYRCRLLWQSCYTVWSDPATLRVLPAAKAAFACTVSDSLLRCDNQSENAVRYTWDFGDGTMSTDISPNHVYANNGTYLVRLRAIGRCDTAVFEKNIAIRRADRLAAAFGWRDTAACTVVSVRFVNRTPGPVDSLRWVFPGGQPATSTDTMPIVRYQQSGDYAAQLIAYRSNQTNSARQTVSVKVLAPPLAKFDYQNKGAEGLQFLNQSVGAERYSWNFGDGSPTAEAANPLYRYAVPGTYTVTLVADNTCGATVFQLTIVVGVVDAFVPPQNPAWRLYPNPTAGVLYVAPIPQDGKAYTYIVYDIWGRALQGGLLAAPLTTLDLSGLPAGMYTLAVTGPFGRRFFVVMLL